MSLKKTLVATALTAGLVIASVIPSAFPFTTKNVVSAETISTYTTMLQNAYSQLSNAEKQSIIDVREAIKGMNDSNWDTLINNPTLYTNLEHAFGAGNVDNVLGEFASLFYLDSDLSTRLETFKTNYTNQFKVLFGSDFTFNELTDFLDDVADKAVIEIGAKAFSGDLAMSDLESAMTAAVNSALGLNPKFEGKLDSIGTSISEVLSIKDALESALMIELGDAVVDNAKSATFGAIARANSSINLGSSVSIGTHSLVYTILYSGNSVNLNNSYITWRIAPSSSIASVSGSQLSVTGTGTFTLEAVMNGIVVGRKNITAIAATGGGSNGGTPSTGTTQPTPTQPSGTKEVPVTENTTTNSNGQTTNEVTVKAEEATKAALDSKEPVNLVLKASKAADVTSAPVPTDLINKLNTDDPNNKVTLSTPAGAVAISAAELSNALLAAAAKGIDAVNAKVNIIIEKGNASDRSAVQNQVGSSSEVLGEVIRARVVISSGNQNEEVNEYNSYVESVIVLDGVFDPSQLVGVEYQGPIGTAKANSAMTAASVTIAPVPTTVTVKDGKTTVTLKKKTSSPFTVVKSNKSFTDVSNQWFAKDVNLLANKLLVKGVKENLFAPDQTLTRAEFATLIVRALGLPEDVSKGVSFSDVKASDWYAGFVGAAAKAGIIGGDGKGNFNPTGSVTRQEIAKMMIAAIQYAGGAVAVPNQADLNKFSDAGKVSNWAANATAQAVAKNLIQGTDGKLNPQGISTRAEAVTFIKRFMADVNFISE